jgi:hypothetical protein
LIRNRPLVNDIGMDLEEWEEEAKKEGMDEVFKKNWADD